MPDVEIVPLPEDREGEAGRMLAQAFVTNPLHVAALGAGRVDLNETFFTKGLEVMKGTKRVALEDGRVVGFVHWVGSERCQLSGPEKAELIPSMVRSFGLATAARMGSWLGEWAKHDPKTPHSHLGPIGVLPAVQGRHVGHRLMQRYCESVDRAGVAGYLETDRRENVAFYERFGFEMTSEIHVLGVPNFLMTRRPAPR